MRRRRNHSLLILKFLPPFSTENLPNKTCRAKLVDQSSSSNACRSMLAVQSLPIKTPHTRRLISGASWEELRKTEKRRGAHRHRASWLSETLTVREKNSRETLKKHTGTHDAFIWSHSTGLLACWAGPLARHTRSRRPLIPHGNSYNWRTVFVEFVHRICSSNSFIEFIQRLPDE